MSHTIDACITLIPLVLIFTLPIWLAVLRRYNLQRTPIRRRGLLLYIGRENVK